jgi:hypothetical protein
MKIRLLSIFRHKGKILKPGSIIEIDSANAEKLISLRKAIEIKNENSGSLLVSKIASDIKNDIDLMVLNSGVDKKRFEENFQKLLLEKLPDFGKQLADGVINSLLFPVIEEKEVNDNQNKEEKKARKKKDEP